MKPLDLTGRDVGIFLGLYEDTKDVFFLRMDWGPKTSDPIPLFR